MFNSKRPKSLHTNLTTKILLSIKFEHYFFPIIKISKSQKYLLVIIIYNKKRLLIKNLSKLISSPKITIFKLITVFVTRIYFIFRTNRSCVHMKISLREKPSRFADNPDEWAATISLFKKKKNNVNSETSKKSLAWKRGCSEAKIQRFPKSLHRWGFSVKFRVCCESRRRPRRVNSLTVNNTMFSQRLYEYVRE